MKTFEDMDNLEDLINVEFRTFNNEYRIKKEKGNFLLFLWPDLYFVLCTWYFVLRCKNEF